MALRNVLVRSLGLRTSAPGCAVSSLLSPTSERMFAPRFTLFDQQISADDRLAQVTLGADDKHLMFRSCVGIHVVNAHRVDVTLTTRVHCKNLFVRVYMAVIQRVHRSCIAPALLRTAVEHAFPLTARKKAIRTKRCGGQVSQSDRMRSAEQPCAMASNQPTGADRQFFCNHRSFEDGGHGSGSK